MEEVVMISLQERRACQIPNLKGANMVLSAVVKAVVIDNNNIVIHTTPTFTSTFLFLLHKSTRALRPIRELRRLPDQPERTLDLPSPFRRHGVHPGMEPHRPALLRARERTPRHVEPRDRALIRTEPMYPTNCSFG